MSEPLPFEAERAYPAGPPLSRPPVPPRRVWAWLALLTLIAAPIELAGHALVRARVPAPEDWEAAAAHVRASHQSTDAILASPGWTDPLVREAVGDVLSLADAGKSDLAPFERLWVFSTRGHVPSVVRGHEPAETRAFGRVTVRRWDLGASSVLHDLTGHIRDAEVTLAVDGAPRSCPRRPVPPGRGGLGAGPMRPREVFVCDPRQDWVWVAQTVVEDLELAPRTCVYQHPSASGPVRATFRDVPLGERVVLYAGIYYEHERKREHGPAYVDVLVDGAPRGRLVHEDGRGWQRLEVPTGAAPGARGEVAIEVSAPDPRYRTLCWAASTRGPARAMEDPL